MIRFLIHTMIASMIFFPTKEHSMKPEVFGLHAEDVWCITKDNVKLHGWFLPAKNQDICLLLFHGNADNISIRLPKANEWVKRGISVLLIDYRGYGKSEGEINSSRDLFEDAEAALEWLGQTKNFKPERIVLYGESIGAVPVLELAQKADFKSIILEAPFTSLKELAKVHYGFAPDILLKDFEMNNEAKISKIKSPVLIVHGTEDEVVPLAMGKRLFEQAPEPKKFLEIQSAHHNDIASVGNDKFYREPFEFATQSK